jgi:hypothetical protein
MSASAAVCDECQKVTPSECYSTCCACGSPVCHNCGDPNESYYCKPHQLIYDKTEDIFKS